MRSDPSISALRLRLAQEAAQFGYWDYEVATHALIWDSSCAALFGITLEEFSGTMEAFRSQCHPEDLPAVEQALATMSVGESLEVTYRVVLPDGSQRTMLSRGQALGDAEGQVERIVGVVLDVTRVHTGAARLGGLARVALALAGAEDDEGLTRIVIEHGAAVLGADGGAVCIRDDNRGVIRLAMTDSLGPEVQLEFGELPLDGPLPGSYTARTGEALFLPDRQAGLAFSPAMQVVYDGTQRDAWAVLPLRASDRLLGSLVVSWAEPRSFDHGDQELLAAFAAQTAQALDRIQVMEAERRQAHEARRLSETLQRSLLTSPPQPEGLQVAVRYAPAAKQAAVGGDWYDAFVVPAGTLTLVIGDCVGHDRQAAAAMATMRNLLRATAYAIGEPPAAVLRALEVAMEGLQVDVLATALLASLDTVPDQPLLQRVTWSNAGHLPPLLLQPDGSVRSLESDPDLLLGISTTTSRHDNEVDVTAGSTLLLYTDGLVERRGEDLDTGIARLSAIVSEFGGLPLETLCDTVLDRMLGDVRGGAEDDVALLAVRVRPPDGVPGAVGSLALASDLGSAREAREFVGSFLERAGHEDWREAAELAVSEVVTNAVLHAHTDLVVTAVLERDCVRVEVRDHNPALPSPRDYDEQATTGRGMALIAAVTDRHGVHSLGGSGKVVWFTVGDGGSGEDPPSHWPDLDADEPATPSAPEQDVVLLGLPANLWQAARQHHDAMVRELTLLRAAKGLPTDDLAAADAARRSISDVVDLALRQLVRPGSSDAPMPVGQPSPLPVPLRKVDAVLPTALAAAAYAALQDVLDEGEALARADELLVRPGLPEVIAVRDWACEQVIAQLGGTEPSPWPGTDDQRFTELTDESPRAPEWDASTVAASGEGLIAVDDANRILAVSAPLLAVLGYSSQELVGRRVVLLIPSRYREAHVAGFTRHLTSGVSHVLGVGLELPVLRADGSEVLCDVLIEVVPASAGRSVYTARISPAA